MLTDGVPAVAVVGCGYWGKNLVRNFAQLRALRWICDADEAALQRQAQLYPGVRTTVRLEDVLADGKEQKLVVVGQRKMAVFDDMAREGQLKIYDNGIEWRAGLPVPRQTA